MAIHPLQATSSSLRSEEEMDSALVFICLLSEVCPRATKYKKRVMVCYFGCGAGGTGKGGERQNKPSGSPSHLFFFLFFLSLARSVSSTSGHCPLLLESVEQMKKDEGGK